MKIHLVKAELYHADRRSDERTEGHTDGQTYITKLIVALHKFLKKPKMQWTLRKLLASF
jgi:hypothetical protein